MTTAIALYSFAVALIASGAAWLIERVCVLRGWPRRGVWVVALSASFCYPIVTILTADTEPKPLAAQSQVRTAERTYPVAAAARLILIRPSIGKQPWRTHDLDDAFVVCWILASTSCAAVAILAARTLRRRSERWQWRDVDGQIVLITDGEGPAVMGFFEPEIIFPCWLLAASMRTRQMVFAHERQHIAARDPLLVLTAMLFVVLAPWNLPLWWQLRRLRFAIEVDCDARATQHEVGLASYAETLIAVGRRRATLGLGSAALALTARRSQLERRIRVLVAVRDQRIAPSVVATAVALALCVFVSRWEAPHFVPHTRGVSSSGPTAREPRPTDGLTGLGLSFTFPPIKEVRTLGLEISSIAERRLKGLGAVGALAIFPIPVRRKPTNIPEILVTADRHAAPESLRLADVLAGANRQRQTQIIVLDHELEDLRLHPGFHVSAVDAFLAELKAAYGIRALETVAPDGRPTIFLIGPDTEDGDRAEQVLQFEIPESDMESALRKFADRTGMQVLYRSIKAELYGQVREVRGQLTPTEAMALLLDGTDCRAQLVHPKTMLVFCTY